MKKTSLFRFAFAGILCLTYLNSCKHSPDDIVGPGPGPGPENCDTTNVTYNGTVFPIFQENCVFCHNSNDLQGNIDLTNYTQVAFLAGNGFLAGAIKHLQGYSPMPKDGNQLDDCKIRQIEIWIRDTTFTPPPPDDPCDPDTVYFEADLLPIIASSCGKTGCHDGTNPDEDALPLLSYATVMASGFVVPGNPGNSEMMEAITETDPEKRMPPPPENPLPAEQIALIQKWIAQGAQNLSCDGECDTANVTFSGVIWPEIINKHCYGCHKGAEAGGGVHLENYNNVAAAAAIPAGQPGSLWGAITHNAGNKPMPRNQPKLSDCKISQIQMWIEDGRPNN